MSILNPERYLGSLRKISLPSPSPLPRFHCIPIYQCFFSLITNVRRPYSCLVCDAICFLFIAKGLGGLLLLFSWGFTTKTPGTNIPKPLLFPNRQNILQETCKQKSQPEPYAQPTQRQSTSTQKQWLGSTINYNNSLCTYSSKPCSEERLYSHPGVCPPHSTWCPAAG